MRTLFVFLTALATVLSATFLNFLPGNTHVRAQDTGVTSQAVSLASIRLQHRKADAVRIAITPLLAQGGSIGQIDDVLVISSSAANLSRLREAIRALDLPPRPLLLSVDNDYWLPGTTSGDGDSQDSTTSAETETGTGTGTDTDTDTGEAANPTAQPERFRLMEGEPFYMEMEPGTETRISAELMGEQIILRLNDTRIITSPGEWVVLNPEDQFLAPLQAISIVLQP